MSESVSPSLRFSVVIPALNGLGPLERLWRCLEAQSFPRSEFECVVVEAGTQQESAPPQWARDLAITTRRVSGTIRGSRAQAREMGWRQAAGEIVVFLDDDLLPASDWLAAYHAAFEQNASDIISGGRYRIEADPEPVDVGAGLQKRRAEAKLGLSAHPVFEKLERQLPELCRVKPDSLVCAYSFMAANAAVRKTQLQKTSGFNPCWQQFDDLELGIRLWEVGARFGFADGAEAYRVCPPGEMGRWLNVNELLALFCRHPYTLILMMDFWAFYNSPGAPAPPWPIFDRLSAMVEAAGQLTSEDLSKEFIRRHKQRLPAACEYSRDLALQFFSDWSGTPTTQIEAYLDLGVARGLFCERRGPQLYFDISHAGNWVRDNTDYFQECLLRNGYEGGIEKKTPFLRSQDRADLLVLDCCGSYELSLPTEALRGPWEGAVLNLPLPVEHTCQTGVEITRCFPENLLDHADSSRAAVVGFPINHAAGDEIRIGYEFRCRLHEFAPRKRDASERADSDLARFLRPTIPASHLPKAKAILEQVLPGAVTDSLEAARAIYIWMHDNTLYLDPTFSVYPYFLVLDTGYGACVQLARLFINLCRLAGLPAREQCGAYFSIAYVPGVPNRLEAKLKGQSPFGHTWAEFYTPSHGWVPVEIYGHGPRSLTALNVIDNRLREEVENHLRLFQGELLGYRDPFRIYAAERANKLPAYPVVKSKTGWTSLHELAAQTSHTLTCTFVEAGP